MTLLATVIICTHNPRPDYLGRVLEALESQTLNRIEWELLLIDNASGNSLSEQWKLGWHPNARMLREEELGLTPARLRGIRESQAELLIFVDDDNVLAPDYLARAVSIAKTRPYLGAFGASVSAEFEEPPTPALRKYLVYLAVGELQQDYWGNLPLDGRCCPFGAGLCVRRAVAQSYLRLSENDVRRKQLGRTGNNLTSHEDTDLALCSLDLGLGTGRFKDLRLTHLLAKRRLTEEYIVNLVAGEKRSMLLLKSLRGIEEPPARPKWVSWIKHFIFLLRASKLDRRIFLESRRATMEMSRDLDPVKIAQH